MQYEWGKIEVCSLRLKEQRVVSCQRTERNTSATNETCSRTDISVEQQRQSRVQQSLAQWHPYYLVVDEVLLKRKS